MIPLKAMLLAMICAAWPIPGMRGAELPVWRVEGEMEDWAHARNELAEDGTPRKRGYRQTRFALEFTEGGQWRMEFRNSIDGFSQLREVACDHGDLFYLIRDAEGLIAIGPEKLKFRETARVGAGPINFCTAQAGVIWWLYCSRYASRGQSTFSVTDFLGISENRPVFCVQETMPGVLGVEQAKLFTMEPFSPRELPAAQLKTTKLAKLGANRIFPAEATVEELSGGAVSAVYRIKGAKIIPIMRPPTFRPKLGGPAFMLDERAPLWRVKYVTTNWLSLPELQQRLATGQGVTAEHLGRQPLPARAPAGLPIY